MEQPSPLRLAGTLTIGIGAVSCASVFIRLAAAPALAAAALRVLWAALILAPLVLAGPVRELLSLSWRERTRLILSGAALALHFGLWITSLSHTSVASSVLLVDTTPFFIGLASPWVLGKLPARGFWFGLAIALVGCAGIVQEDWSTSRNSAQGNLLALGGAVAMAAYFLVGATARQKLSLLAYVWPVYATAASLLLLACLVSRTPLTGYPNTTTLFLFLLGLIPQGVGHTTYNWSLRWLSPALVALISLAEPVGAGLLAFFILGEGLSPMKIASGGIILMGIYIATRSETPETTRTERQEAPTQ